MRTRAIISSAALRLGPSQVASVLPFYEAVYPEWAAGSLQLSVSPKYGAHHTGPQRRQGGIRLAAARWLVGCDPTACARTCVDGGGGPLVGPSRD